jgi:hypothetical protein
VTTSFIGWVTSGSGLRSGLASTCLKSAWRPPTTTRETSRSWKSRLKLFSFDSALASIFVVAESSLFASGS